MNSAEIPCLCDARGSLTRPTARISAFRTTKSTVTTQNGFGLKLGCPLRDRWVTRSAKVVQLELEGLPDQLEVKLRGGFWNKCAEFMHEAIHGWILGRGLPIPWQPGKPHHFEMERISGTEFRVRQVGGHQRTQAIQTINKKKTVIDSNGCMNMGGGWA
jgi:hypothetical protein